MKATHIYITAPSDYPIYTLWAIVTSNEKEQEIPQLFPFNGGWGDVDKQASPCTGDCTSFDVEIVWLSVVENIFYVYQTHIEKQTDIEIKLLFGLAPNGDVAIWNYSEIMSRESHSISPSKTRFTGPVSVMDENVLPSNSPSIISS